MNHGDTRYTVKPEDWPVDCGSLELHSAWRLQTFAILCGHRVSVLHLAVPPASLRLRDHEGRRPHVFTLSRPNLELLKQRHETAKSPVSSGRVF